MGGVQSGLVLNVVSWRCQPHNQMKISGRSLDIERWHSGKTLGPELQMWVFQCIEMVSRAPIVEKIF